MAEEENFDRKVRDKFKDQERPLPPGLWANIDKALPPTPPGNGGSSPWLWLGGAVGIVVVSAILYFTLSNSSSIENNNTTTENSSPNNTYQRNTLSSTDRQRGSASLKNSNGTISSTSSTDQTAASVSGTNSSGSSTDGSTNAVANHNSSVGNNGLNNNATNTTSTNNTNYSSNHKGVNSTARDAGNTNSSTNNKGGNLANHDVTTGSNTTSGRGVKTNGGIVQGNNAGSTAHTSGQNHTANTNNTNSNSSNNNKGTNGTVGTTTAAGIATGSTTQNSSSPSTTNNFSNTDPSLGIAGTTTTTPSDIDATDNNQNASTNSNPANATSVHQNKAADSTNDDRSTLPIVIPAAVDENSNSSLATTASSNTTTNSDSADAHPVNKNEVDSTHSIMNPAYPQTISGNPDSIEVMNVKVDSLKTNVDSTLAVIDSTKEKQKQDKNRAHVFSAEVYGGGGYGAYGLGLNPGTRVDSASVPLMDSRFNREKNSTPFSYSFGFRMNYKISERFEVHAGLRYQQYSQSYHYELRRLDSIYFAPPDSHHLHPLYHYTAFPYSGKEKTTFISIPIGVTYNHTMSDKVTVYGRGAVELRFVNSTGWNVMDFNGNVHSSGKPTSTFNLGMYVAAGAQYKLKGNWSLYAEPHCAFTIQNLYKKSDSVKQYPLSIGIMVGVRYQF